MNRIDRISKVDPDVTGERQVIYERWRAGLRWMAIGALAVGAGAGINLGLEAEEGLALEAAGTVVTIIGATRAGFNLGRLHS